MDEESPEVTKISENGLSFQVHRVCIYVMCCLTYALVFFHRGTPAILSSEMAEVLNVEESSMSIFSSMYFWPYAIMQPFCGVVADIIEPGYLISAACFISAIGAFICGISDNFSLSVFGRFVVGFGCSPVYVPMIRIITQWFPLKNYAILAGIVLACGGCGGIIAQTPLAEMQKVLGWRWGFYIVAIIGFVFGFIYLFGVRADPGKFKYHEVEGASPITPAGAGFKSKMLQLWNNVKSVAIVKEFWLICIYCFFVNGNCFNLSGLWGGPYIREVFGYDSVKTGNMLLSLSLAMIIGSIVLPIISDAIHNRTMCLMTFGILGTVCSIIMCVLDTKMNFAAAFAVLFIYGVGTVATTSVSFPFIRETFPPNASATAIGFTNLSVFLGAAIFQNITGAILENSDKNPMENIQYTPKAYQEAVWIPHIIYCAVGIVVPIFCKETHANVYKSDEGLKSNDEMSDLTDKEKENAKKKKTLIADGNQELSSSDSAEHIEEHTIKEL